jgi:hypothetical protein
VAVQAQKEKMQKKYAKDDPTDYRKHHYNTADLADERRYKKAPVKLGGSGSWGSSGTPDKQKWYSDGVISSDGWVDKKGHYLLGAHRRRVGAGTPTHFACALSPFHFPFPFPWRDSPRLTILPTSRLRPASELRE